MALFDLYSPFGERLLLLLFSDEDTKAQRRHPSREQRIAGTHVYRTIKFFHSCFSREEGSGRAVPERKEQPGSNKLFVMRCADIILGML